MADYAALKKYAEMLGCVCKENEPMSEHTTFRIGGPADIFIEPTSPETLADIVAACKRWEIPVHVVGNGSNLLVSDLGIEGAVIHISGGLCDISLNGAYELECGSGVKLSKLCTIALEHSLTGLEFAWGIPGTAGGAAYMNAGAYGSEMSDVLIKCTHIDADGKFGSYEGKELAFGYRQSVYTDSDKIITSLKLRLKPDDPVEIRSRMDELFKLRKEKQPLEYPSAGSVFKRPHGNFAGSLIEQCGLKGFTIGGAQVNQKHAGFIINLGNATCYDVRKLIEHIKEEVFLQTSIKLETEIKFIGRI